MVEPSSREARKHSRIATMHLLSVLRGAHTDTSSFRQRPRHGLEAATNRLYSESLLWVHICYGWRVRRREKEKAPTSKHGNEFSPRRRCICYRPAPSSRSKEYTYSTGASLLVASPATAGFHHLLYAVLVVISGE